MNIWKWTQYNNLHSRYSRKVIERKRFKEDCGAWSQFKLRYARRNVSRNIRNIDRPQQVTTDKIITECFTLAPTQMGYDKHDNCQEEISWTLCLLNTNFGKHFTSTKNICYKGEVPREIVRIDLQQALRIIQTINANNELSPVLLRILRVVTIFYGQY
jgi:hypothetical protein